MNSKLRIALIVMVLLLGVIGSVFAENMASKVFGTIAPTNFFSNISSFGLGGGGY